jgi:hypothetical protein
MATTANRIIADVAVVEVQQTAALQLVSAALAVGNNAQWINVSSQVKSLAPGAPGDRAMTEEFNASQSAPMISVSKVIPSHSPEITFYWTNGVAASVGLTPDTVMNVHDDIFMPALMNDIVLPIRYAVRGTVGDPLFTYALAKVRGITPPDVAPGATDSAVWVARMTAPERTDAVVA